MFSLGRGILPSRSECNSGGLYPLVPTPPKNKPSRDLPPSQQEKENTLGGEIGTLAHVKANTEGVGDIWKGSTGEGTDKKESNRAEGGLNWQGKRLKL